MGARWSKMSRSGKIVIGGLAATLACLCCVGALISSASRGSQTASAQASATVISTSGPTSTTGPTPTSTATPPPSATYSAEEALKQALLQALGPSNRSLDRVTDVKIASDGEVEIHWTINDNLGNNMIVLGAKDDAVKILHAVFDSIVPYQSVWLLGTFSMQDKSGNATEDQVVNATYLKATIQKINWQNFDSNNIWDIADQNNVLTLFR